MNLRLPLLAAVLLSFPALAGDAATPGKSSDKGADRAVISRGEKLKGEPKVDLKQLLAEPDKHAGKTVAVEGKVRQACSKKGCWMELAPEMATAGAGVRVTFKDYGFFVPLDSAGSTAKLEGVVKIAELSEARAKHLEEEGATVQRAKDGKAREVHVVASGVELRR